MLLRRNYCISFFPFLRLGRRCPKSSGLFSPSCCKCCLTSSPAHGSGEGGYDGDGMVATDAQSILQIVRRTAAHHNDTIFQIANEGLQQRLREPQEAEPANIQALFRFICTVPTPSLRSDCCIRFEQAAGQLWLQDDPSEACDSGWTWTFDFDHSPR